MNRPHRDKDFEEADLPRPARSAGAQTGAPDGRDAETASGLNPLARRTALLLRDDSYSPSIITGMLRLFEFSGFALTGFLVFFAYLDMPLTGSPHYALAILAGSALAVAALQLADAYMVPALRSAAGTLPRALVAWIAAFGALAAAAFFLKLGETYSRVWFACWFAGGAIFLVACRTFVAIGIRKWARNGRMERSAVIVGGGPDARDLIRALERQPANDIRICGIFDDRDRGALAADRCRLSEARQRRRPCLFVRLARVDMLDHLAADQRRGTRAGTDEEAVGPSDRYPARRACQRASTSARDPIPTSAACRCSTCSTAQSRTGIRWPSEYSTSSSASSRCRCFGRSCSARPSR